MHRVNFSKSSQNDHTAYEDRVEEDWKNVKMNRDTPSMRQSAEWEMKTM